MTILLLITAAAVTMMMISKITTTTVITLIGFNDEFNILIKYSTSTAAFRKAVRHDIQVSFCLLTAVLK